jgi:hypothetical protein
MNESKRKEPGAFVSWASQAGGITCVKEGTVVAFVPKGQSVQAHLPSDSRTYALHGIPQSARTDRYLIKRSPRLREKVAHYYTPVASVVERGA